MKLVGSGFNGNGKLVGSLIAVDDLGEPRGWESIGNWSSQAFVERNIKGLAATVGVPVERARAAVAQALREARRQAGIPVSGDDAQPQHDKPVVVVTGRQARELEAEAWKILEPAPGEQPQFFALGSSIVHLEHGDNGPYLHTLMLAGLRRHLEAGADFVTVGDKGESPTVAPRTTLEDMLAVPQPPLPPIRGVVTTPMLTPDGSVLASEGYHPTLGLYMFLGTPIPQLSPAPGASDVQRAKNLVLQELLGDFPFSSDADRAHAIAALLTPLVRVAIAGPTPLHMVEAPLHGTGKGLFTQIVARIVTGGGAAVMTEARDDDEWRKRITAKLKTAPALVLIDNVRRRLDSAALSAALTEPVWEDRELGVSRMVRLPIRCTWMATGNNPSLSGEMSRRVARIRIDSQAERPWERGDWRHDPLETWVQEHRGDLLWALLTLVQAWVANGRPPGTARMGRFQQWADTVGGILKVADVPGFLENRAEVYAAAAAEAEGWRTFVELWWKAYGEQRVTVDKLFDLARENKLRTELRSERNDRGARVAMGMELSSMRDRRIGDWVIRYVGTGHGGAAIFLLKVARVVEKDSPHPPDSPAAQSSDTPQSGGCGETGESFSGTKAVLGKNTQGPPPGPSPEALALASVSPGEPGPEDVTVL